MSQALAALDSFLALSEAMASAAEAQEWDDLVRLGEERGAFSDNPLNLPANLGAQLLVTEQARGRMIIRRCQQLDLQTRALVENRQQALRVLLREPKSVT